MHSMSEASDLDQMIASHGEDEGEREVDDDVVRQEWNYDQR